MAKLVAKIVRLTCPTCHYTEEFMIRDFDNPPTQPCRDCSEVMTYNRGSRLYWKPFTPHYSHQLDQTFNTRDEERTYAKKNKLVDISGEIKAAKSGRVRWRNQW